MVAHLKRGNKGHFKILASSHFQELTSAGKFPRVPEKKKRVHTKRGNHRQGPLISIQTKLFLGFSSRPIMKTWV